MQQKGAVKMDAKDSRVKDSLVIRQEARNRYILTRSITEVLTKREMQQRINQLRRERDSLQFNLQKANEASEGILGIELPRVERFVSTVKQALATGKADMDLLDDESIRRLVDSEDELEEEDGANE
jgi:hypothetical protein